MAMAAAACAMATITAKAIALATAADAATIESQDGNAGSLEPGALDGVGMGLYGAGDVTPPDKVQMVQVAPRQDILHAGLQTVVIVTPIESEEL